jgi:pilus assembly protein Flp/PilA
MMNKLKGLVVEEQGQGMTEYGLVLGVIAVGVVAVLVTLKEEIQKMFDAVLTSVQGRDAS